VNEPRTLALLAGALLLLLYSSRARAREDGPAGQIGVTPSGPEELVPSIWEDLNLTGTRLALAEQAFEAAVAAGVPPAGFTKQLAVESAFNPRATSWAGAVGLAQFMVGTGIQYDVITMPSEDEETYFDLIRYARETLSGDEEAFRIATINAATLANPRTTDRRTDPTRSINAGLRYMQVLHGRYSGEAEPWSLALVAYNWGSGNVRKWLAGTKSPPASTLRYVRWIAPYYGENPAWAEESHV